MRYGSGCCRKSVLSKSGVESRLDGAHNPRAKQQGGCKVRVCYLPVKAPWLNPIEPKWLHGKRAIVEPDRKLTAEEVKQRVHEHYHCEAHEPLTQSAA